VNLTESELDGAGDVEPVVDPASVFCLVQVALAPFFVHRDAAETWMRSCRWATKCGAVAQVAKLWPGTCAPGRALRNGRRE
jgi:hypothetical protein